LSFLMPVRLAMLKIRVTRMHVFLHWEFRWSRAVGKCQQLIGGPRECHKSNAGGVVAQADRGLLHTQLPLAYWDRGPLRTQTTSQRAQTGPRRTHAGARRTYIGSLHIQLGQQRAQTGSRRTPTGPQQPPVGPLHPQTESRRTQIGSPRIDRPAAHRDRLAAPTGPRRTQIGSQLFYILHNHQIIIQI
jgi:hypothetical protein